MNIKIHASSSQVVTMSMRDSIVKYAQVLEQITPEDTTLHYSVKNAFHQKENSKVKLVLSNHLYTLEVHSENKDFYNAVDEATDKMKHLIRKKNKKLYDKKKHVVKETSVEREADDLDSFAAELEMCKAFA